MSAIQRGAEHGKWFARCYDHVIVGAGSAGCVVARRLVDAGAAVLLLEAGGPGDGAASLSNLPQWLEEPRLPSANTNAPSIMIGEFASRLLVAGGAGASVPNARKDRLTGSNPVQETAERPPYHSP